MPRRASDLNGIEPDQWIGLDEQVRHCSLSSAGCRCLNGKEPMRNSEEQLAGR